MNQQEQEAFENEIKSFVLKYKAELSHETKLALTEVSRLETTFEEFKSEVLRGFANQEHQRATMNDELKGLINKLIQSHEESKAKFEKHDEVEMEKYDKVVEHQEASNKLMENLISKIDTIAIETEENTGFINNLRKYWGRIVLISTGVGSTLGGLYWLYLFLQKNGLVIVFEKAQ